MAERQCPRPPLLLIALPIVWSSFISTPIVSRPRALPVFLNVVLLGRCAFVGHIVALVTGNWWTALASFSLYFFNCMYWRDLRGGVILLFFSTFYNLGANIAGCDLIIYLLTLFYIQNAVWISSLSHPLQRVWWSLCFCGSLDLERRFRLEIVLIEFSSSEDGGFFSSRLSWFPFRCKSVFELDVVFMLF